MVIGLLQVEFLLQDTRSLKHKRSVIARLRTQTQKKFNVSFSEVGMQDTWGRAEIAMTTASNSTQMIHKMFSALEKHLELFPAVTIISRHMEVL